MLGALKNIAKYKIKNDSLEYFPYKEDAPDIGVWWRENKDAIERKKIPTIILEEIYGIKNCLKYQHISGLHLVYFLRENKYTGPILIISLFNQNDVKSLVFKQNNRFREKTERILYTSNILFVNITEIKRFESELYNFCKFPELEISDFTRKDLLRYSISNKAATEQLFHDLKNSISEGELDFDSRIYPSLEKIKNDYVDANSVNTYQELLSSFEENFKSSDSKLELIELAENLKKMLFAQKIILDISINQNDADDLLDKIRNEQWQVLIIEDNLKLGKEILQHFIRLGFRSKLAKNYDEALSICSESENLIWIVSDYRLYKHNLEESSNKVWQTLQGTDLLIELYNKLDEKKVHLSILTSKRDILNKAIKENWDPPITFFNKRLLSESLGFDVFVETQLAYLDKINESNKSRFITPESWKNTKDITFRKNSKEYKDFRIDSGKTGIIAVEAFKIEKPKEYENATWISNWTYLKSLMRENKEWDIFNNLINEEISSNYKGIVSVNFWRSHIPENFLGLLNRNKPIDFKKKMKGRLLYRRVFLIAAINYRESVNHKNIKRKKFLEDIHDTLGIGGNVHHFCDATGFNPDEIFNSDLKINRINLPNEERLFLKFIKDSN